jgi:small GTP-binding protein
MKIHVLGDAGVGKTSLIHLLQNREFDSNYSPTSNAKYYEMYYDLLQFQVWDTPLEEKYDVDYNLCELVLIMFDVTRPDTFTNACFWYNKIRETSKTPILFIANKCDIQRLYFYKEKLDNPCLNISLKTRYNCDKLTFKINELFDFW